MAHVRRTQFPLLVLINQQQQPSLTLSLNELVADILLLPLFILHHQHILLLFNSASVAERTSRRDFSSPLWLSVRTEQHLQLETTTTCLHLPAEEQQTHNQPSTRTLNTPFLFFSPRTLVFCLSFRCLWSRPHHLHQHAVRC